MEIFETAVYCCRLKEWRILNVNTATVYSGKYESEGEALADIEDGEQRAGKTVKRVPLKGLHELLVWLKGKKLTLSPKI